MMKNEFGKTDYFLKRCVSQVKLQLDEIDFKGNCLMEWLAYLHEHFEQEDLH